MVMVSGGPYATYIGDGPRLMAAPHIVLYTAIHTICAHRIYTVSTHRHRISQRFARFRIPAIYTAFLTQSLARAAPALAVAPRQRPGPQTVHIYLALLTHTPAYSLALSIFMPSQCPTPLQPLNIIPSSLAVGIAALLWPAGESSVLELQRCCNHR